MHAGIIPTLRSGVLRVADIDLSRAFVLMAAEIGLWVILRPGPYICSEIDLGACPGERDCGDSSHSLSFPVCLCKMRITNAGLILL